MGQGGRGDGTGREGGKGTKTGRRREGGRKGGREEGGMKERMGKWRVREGRRDCSNVV